MLQNPAMPPYETAHKPEKRIAVVVINYRTYQLTVDCVSSLEHEIDPERDVVIIVDNASGDDSPDRLEATLAEQRWNSWVTLLRSPVNGGFSAGNNRGVESVSAQAYLLLNSDTIAKPGAIKTLWQALTAAPEIGIAGARLEYPDGTMQTSRFRRLTPLAELPRAASTSVVSRLLPNRLIPLPPAQTTVDADWVSFACVLIRREVFQAIGPMDEGYFMYYEDGDFCRRAWDAGWKVVHCPDAEIVHFHGKSGSVEDDKRSRNRRPRFYYEARARYFAKFYGKFGLTAANLWWTLGRLIALVRELAGNKKPTACKNEHWDIWIDWRHAPRPPSTHE